MKKTHFWILTLGVLALLTFGPLTTFAQNVPSKVLRGHTSSVYSVAFSPDGSRLASGSLDRTIRLWDGVSGEYLSTLKGHTGYVLSIAFSPDGSRLASGSLDRTIRLWDGVSGEYLSTLEGHTHYVTSVAFSPDGSRIASGSRDNTIRLWDGVSGEYLSTLEGHTHYVTSVAFSPDGSRLASGSDDNTIRLWNAATGEHLSTLEGHTHYVTSVAFSPDGSSLASGSGDNTIRLWNAAIGEHLSTLEGHTGDVNSVAFSPDGSSLASGSDDWTIRLWNATTGEHLSTLTRHRNDVNSVVFSPDGSRLASGSSDGDIRLWTIPKTYISITAGPEDAPAIGDKLTLRISITDGENITGYQAKIIFDDTALRYVESANGDYLPADSFFVPPVVEGNQVTLGATSINGDSSGDGTLATLTFEFIAIKESNLTFTTDIVDSSGSRLVHGLANSVVAAGVPRLREDVNLDGVVNILDLTLVAASFGKSAFLQVGQEVPRGDVNKDGVVDIKDLIELTILNVALVLDEYSYPNTGDTVGLYGTGIGNILADAWNNVVVTTPVRNPADVNEDDVIDIIDLVLVAGALGNKAAAPALYPQARGLFTAADVKLWLSEAQHKNLTDAQSQRGILFLQQLLAAFTPKKTALLPNYPNPFNPETWIPYQLAAPADVTLTIYAIDGTVVRTLALGHQSPGLYQDRSRAAYWDGKNALGEPVASGVYFYTLTAGNFTATRKMLIRK